MATLKVSNDNHAPYWSQPVLDRAREMTARLEARKRAAAKHREPRHQSPNVQSQRPIMAEPGWWRLWDELGMPVQYGLTVVAALFLVVAAMELLSLRTMASQGRRAKQLRLLVITVPRTRRSRPPRF